VAHVDKSPALEGPSLEIPPGYIDVAGDVYGDAGQSVEALVEGY
jgi:hypothetical protein